MPSNCFGALEETLFFCAHLSATNFFPALLKLLYDLDEILADRPGSSHHGGQRNKSRRMHSVQWVSLLTQMTFLFFKLINFFCSDCTYNPGFNYHITPQLQDRIQCSSDHDKSACAGCCVSWALSLGITTVRYGIKFEKKFIFITK